MTPEISHKRKMHFFAFFLRKNLEKTICSSYLCNRNQQNRDYQMISKHGISAVYQPRRCTKEEKSPKRRIYLHMSEKITTFASR